MSGFTDFLGKTTDLINNNQGAIKTAGQVANGVAKKGSVGKSALSGAATGASIGATVGTVVPVIGNVIGAAAGGIIGGIVGLFSGKKKKKKAAELAKQQALAKQNGTQAPEAPKKGGLFNNTSVGATLGKALMGSLAAALVSYIIKDIGDNKKLDFSAKLFGKTETTVTKPPVTPPLATPGINPYNTYTNMRI